MSENARPAARGRSFNASEFFQKYTMSIALVVVTIVFSLWKGKEGLILLPSNVAALIAENAYVFILATGMLMCILTGGNIDLSVGSIVCFTAAIGCNMMVVGVNMWVADSFWWFTAGRCGRRCSSPSPSASSLALPTA